MPIWIILAALGSIMVTAALSWVLWRLNATGPARAGSAPHAGLSDGDDSSDGGGDGGD